jgi:hypothetical protein
MALLGVAVPKINGNQVAIDLFPETTKRKRSSLLGGIDFHEFIVVRLGMLQQRYLWECFQRVLNMTEAKCWDVRLRRKLLDLDWEAITPPRNHFLYKAHYWPLSDLIKDGTASDFSRLSGMELDVEEPGFLLCLCFSVYYLFDQLMCDLAEYSAVVKQQTDEARIFASAGLAVVNSYTNFVAQISAAGAT